MSLWNDYEDEMQRAKPRADTMLALGFALYTLAMLTVFGVAAVGAYTLWTWIQGV